MIFRAETLTNVEKIAIFVRADVQLILNELSLSFHLLKLLNLSYSAKNQVNNP